MHTEVELEKWSAADIEKWAAVTIDQWSSEDSELEKWAAKRKKDLAETQKREFEMWQQWKEGGEKPNDLRPLLKSFKPMVRSRANHWARRAELPPESVHAEFNRQFVNALKTYDPNKGAALGSWVTGTLRKAQRWVSQHQDPTRVQEHRYYKMGEWDNALATLDDRLGREPSTREMAEYLGWSEAEAGRMESEKRKSLYSSGFGGFDPTVVMPSREAEILRLIRYELSPEELQVCDYTVGTHGKPKLRPGEIAKKLNMSPSKVTRIRNSIAGKIRKYSE